MVLIGNVKRFQQLDVLFFCVFVDKFVWLLLCGKRGGIDLVVFPYKIFFLIYGKIVRSTFRKIVGFFFVKGFIQIHYFSWSYPVQDFFLSSSSFFIGHGLCQVHLCVDPCLLVFNISGHKRYEQCVFFFCGRIGKLGCPFPFIIILLERFVFIVDVKYAWISSRLFFCSSAVSTVSSSVSVSLASSSDSISLINGV